MIVRSSKLGAIAAPAVIALLSAGALPVAAQAASPVAAAALETRPGNGAGYQPAFPGQTRAIGVDSKVALDVKTVAQGLNMPWAFELLPDGRFLVSERPGNLRLVTAAGQVSEPVKGLPPIAVVGQGGLLDVALDPAFATNRVIYFSFAEARDGGNGTSLARARLVEDASGASLADLKVIFQQTPALNSSLHFGSRIAFGKDGKLFLTLGERSIPAGMVQSQDLNSHLGKVVRLNTDGTVPADNPFVGKAGAKPEIWSYGHRNVQAATIDSATGKLWTVEHGPRGGDELNQPQAGVNHGWPVITYGINYNGQKMTGGIQQQAGLQQPVYYWDPVIAPSGMMIYHGALFPQWKGSIFVGGLSGLKLVRLQMEGDRVVGEEWLLTDQPRRLRDVQQGADGAIYVLVEGGDNSQLLKLTPRPGA